MLRGIYSIKNLHSSH